MNQRRMIDNNILTSAIMRRLPSQACLLYVCLILNADDEGFIENPQFICSVHSMPKKLLRTLTEAGYLHIFPSGVGVILHWHLHNKLSPSRMRKTFHLEERAQLILQYNKIYALREKSAEIPQQNVAEDAAENAENLQQNVAEDAAEIAENLQQNVAEDVTEIAENLQQNVALREEKEKENGRRTEDNVTEVKEKENGRGTEDNVTEVKEKENGRGTEDNVTEATPSPARTSTPSSVSAPDYTPAPTPAPIPTPATAPPPTPSTSPPTKEELRDFAARNGLTHVDIDRFYSYYTATSWRATTGSPIQWRLKLKDWDEADKSKPRTSRPSPPPPERAGSFDTDEFFQAALQRAYGDTFNGSQIQSWV